MGDLHSIPYSSNTLYSCSSLGNWDYFHDDLQVFNTRDISPFMENTPPFLSNFDSETGYLQDALFKFSSKRRRLLLFDDNDNNQTKESNNSIKNIWSATIDQHFSEDYYDSFSQITKCDSFSGDPMSRSVSKMSEEYSNYYIEDMKGPEEEAISASHDSNSDKEAQQYYSTYPSFSSGAGDQKRSRKRITAKVVYPFGLVKPGGQEGDVTLNDINERILMRPTRPVRHPVGDYAFRPTVSPAGPGLSGKTVVALTKIQTQGRGTITIIRTRG